MCVCVWLSLWFDGLCLYVCVCVCVCVVMGLDRWIGVSWVCVCVWGVLCVESVLEVEGEREEKKNCWKT